MSTTPFESGVRNIKVTNTNSTSGSKSGIFLGGDDPLGVPLRDRGEPLCLVGLYVWICRVLVMLF